MRRNVSIVGALASGGLAVLLFAAEAGLPAQLAGQTAASPSARPFERQTFDAAVAHAAELSRVRSLLISVDGTIVREHYFRGASAARPQNVKSVSKSIISLLVGIAIDRGAIESVSDPIGRYLPDHAQTLKTAPPITVEDLLTMRSGLETTSNRNYGRWVQSPNWVRHVLRQPMVDEPGGRMIYSTGNTHVLSAILTSATGMSTLDFARRHAGVPLGIAVRSWTRDPQGIYFGGNEMSFTSREMVAIGQLYLDGGRRGDRQIVSERWVHESAVPRATSERRNDRRYGYGWWLAELAGRDVMYAWGFGGQFIFVIPNFNAVVVATSVAEPGDERREQRDAIYDIVEEDIIPVMETLQGQR